MPLHHEQRERILDFDAMFPGAVQEHVGELTDALPGGWEEVIGGVACVKITLGRIAYAAYVHELATVSDGVEGVHGNAAISAWKPRPSTGIDLGAPEIELVCGEIDHGISGTQFQALEKREVISWLTGHGVTAVRGQFGPGLTIVRFDCDGHPVTVRFGHAAFELIKKSFAEQ